ncbi:DUF599 domain-containing protein [Pontivivens insulae]|uniref:DUF599 domain-containing protein n=1 Tax=Pontivivens insulae TaxID=1639689 RepID=A0A2R8AG52_9RHOB|nr:DUF599 domain-containing protein [Pontivivens insulae]RED12268.1 putative membrane protein [Pontivivens insulae]SPF31025.1 hypothetical protein POI8812_03375 [Pontivivens insulae]
MGDPFITEILTTFGWLDGVALVWVFSIWIVLTWRIEKDETSHPSVHVLMKRFRYRWMEEMAGRDVRIFDSAILNGIRQSTAFFGSTTLIVIGGLAAVIGQPDMLIGAGRGILPDVPAQAVQLKLLLVIGIVAFAFLKFVWSNRLFSYCAIVMAAMPNDGTTHEAKRTAIRAARLNSYAARSFNRGLRALYFAIAAIAWLLGPAWFIAACTLTTLVHIRREFFSMSRTALLAD